MTLFVLYETFENLKAAESVSVTNRNRDEQILINRCCYEGI